MKMSTITYLALVVFISFLLNGCSSAPKAPKKTTGSEVTGLNSDEQKSYQDALALIKTEHPEKAIPPLTRIANSHPEHVGAWINLSHAYFLDGKINEADSALARAKSTGPKIAETYNLQGLILAGKGDYGNAEKNYLTAIQLNDHYPAAHYNLALLYDIYYQDLDKAVAQYDRYLELSDGSDKKTISWVTELKQKIKRRNKS